MPGSDRLVLQAVYPVAERLGALADTVQAAYKQFGEKDYLRAPLKASFILTLTVVLLLSLLAAWYGAIFTAQKLVQPIQDLVKGTRAVAQGDLDTRLPLTSHDEMGFLVHSFNDMTKRLRRARADQGRAQQAAETERANLAVILARLSTGVVSLEPDLRVRTANRAASAILGEELEGSVGRSLGEIGSSEGLLRQFAESCRARLAAGDVEWRDQLTLPGGQRPPCHHVHLHPAAERRRIAGRLRAGVRRHHQHAAGAARRPPGARSRAASRTRSRTRSRRSASRPSACGTSCCRP